ncbi:MAG TPA: hypothetical protein VG937_29670 [Polyangiaceae bacterium]|nr:hypothetical protein [Polyangiaceae bacterium]
MAHPLRLALGSLGQLRNRIDERSELSEAELGDLACLPPVAIDHHAGAVSGPVCHPRLAAAIGERERDEGRPQIVYSNGPARLAGGEEFRARDLRLVQVVAEGLRRSILFDPAEN